MAFDLAKAKAFVEKQLAAKTLTAADIAVLVYHYQAATVGLAADGLPGPKTLEVVRIEIAGLGRPVITPAPGFMIVPESVLRARAVLNQGRYKLGGGNDDPTAPTPFDENGECDCSTLIAWCTKHRKKVDGVYFYTDQIEADAKRQVKGDLGYAVPWDGRQLGDILVYGAGPATGHMGIVSGVGKVIHCRSGRPPAVVETGDQFFRDKGAVVFRFRAVA